MRLLKHRTVFVCVGVMACAGALTATAQRAVVTHEQRLYREPRAEGRSVGRVTVGEEVTITAREGGLLLVSLPGNREGHREGRREGWTLANGVVVLDNNPRAGALLYNAADATAQEDAPEAWRAALRLFRKAASVAPEGPYAPESRLRAAELAWRIESREKGPLAATADLSELNAIIRAYPKTRTAARAGFLLLRTSLCEYWDGTPGCPEAEIGLIEKYLKEYPASEHAAEMRYAVAYRHAALVEIYLQQDKPHFSAENAVAHKAKAREAVETLLATEFDPLWAARGERLIWSLENNVGVFSGIEVAFQKF